MDAPAAYGPCKTLYNRFRRWSETGVFRLIFSELSWPEDAEAEGVLMIDATYVKAHRRASSLKKRVLPLA